MRRIVQRVIQIVQNQSGKLAQIVSPFWKKPALSGLAASLAVVAVIAGCGGNDGPGASRPSDDPEAVAAGFVDALATGDTAAACGLLSDESKGEIARDLAAAEGTPACEEVIPNVSPVSPSEASERRVCHMTVNEDDAYVDFVFGEELSPHVVQFHLDKNADGAFGIDHQGVEDYGGSVDYVCND